MKFKKIILIIVAVLNSKIAFADPNKNKIVRSFSADEYGLEAILEDLKVEKPLIYKKLLPRGESLLSDFRTAKYIGYGSLFVGGALIVNGFVKFASPDKSSSSSSSSDSKANASAAIGSLFLGIGVVWVGSAIATVYQPEKQKLNNFINLHNKLNPDDQLTQSTTSYNFDFNYEPSLEQTKIALNILF
jgi:hypothetical protein